MRAFQEGCRVDDDIFVLHSTKWGGEGAAGDEGTWIIY